MIAKLSPTPGALALGFLTSDATAKGDSRRGIVLARLIFGRSVTDATAS